MVFKCVKNSIFIEDLVIKLSINLLLLERVTYMAAEELVHFAKVLFHKINLCFQDLGRILGVCRWNDLGQRMVKEVRTPHAARSDK